MALTGSTRPPANEPVVDKGGRPTIAWGAFFQEVSDYLTAQSARFDAIETDVADSDAAIAALALAVSTLAARPIVKSGALAVTLDSNGDGTITLPTPFPTAFISGVVGLGSKLYAPGGAVLDHASCTASTLAISIRPNPGAVGVVLTYVVQGT